MSDLLLPEPLREHDDAACVSYLRTYFAPDAAADRYSGAYFERLGSAGNDPDRFTPIDLVAVTMLGIVVPPHAAVAILGKDADTLAGMLADIPADLDLVDADDEHLVEQSPADRLWQRLRSYRGIDWVIAGKLIARKRPRLIPVYDSIVRAAVGAPSPSFWIALRDGLRTGTLRLHDRLLALRSEARIGEDISAIRVFDVIAWMHGRGQQR